MSLLEAIAVFAAGIGAGLINVVVGSGTLITFPVLLAVGFPPLTANVSNTLGLVPGSISGAYGYRRELRGQRRRIIRYGSVGTVGGATGAVLLLVLPDDAFEAIVPVFIALALVLIVVQPRLARWLRARRRDDASPDGGLGTTVAAYGTGVYGGYFGAAQGIILLGVFGLALDDDIQHVNALKNVVAAFVNLMAGIIFAVVADVEWLVVVLIAIGSTLGGVLGAQIGRRLPPVALRGVIVVVGVVAIVQLLR